MPDLTDRTPAESYVSPPACWPRPRRRRPLWTADDSRLLLALLVSLPAAVVLLFLEAWARGRERRHR
jgi:hypothetical protein